MKVNVKNHRKSYSRVIDKQARGAVTMPLNKCFYLRGLLPQYENQRMENRHWNDATKLTVAMLRDRIKMRELHGQLKTIAHKGRSTRGQGCIKPMKKVNIKKK